MVRVRSGSVRHAGNPPTPLYPGQGLRHLVPSVARQGRSAPEDAAGFAVVRANTDADGLTTEEERCANRDTALPRASAALIPPVVRRNGAILYSGTSHEESLYPWNQSVPILSACFELLDHSVAPYYRQLAEDPRHRDLLK